MFRLFPEKRCSEHCRVFTAPCPRDASSSHLRIHAPVSHSVPRHCQASPRIQVTPGWESTGCALSYPLLGLSPPSKWFPANLFFKCHAILKVFLKNDFYHEKDPRKKWATVMEELSGVPWHWIWWGYFVKIIYSKNSFWIETSPKKRLQNVRTGVSAKPEASPLVPRFYLLVTVLWLRSTQTRSYFQL